MCPGHFNACLRWNPLLIVLLQITCAFRLLEPRIELYDRFSPYESGFVGRIDDPENAALERVNEGTSLTRTHPRRWSPALGRQICPNMVGPVGQNIYFCRAKEYGNCDRRTGMCHCNPGYQGLDCRPVNLHITGWEICAILSDCVRVS